MADIGELTGRLTLDTKSYVTSMDHATRKTQDYAKSMGLLSNDRAFNQFLRGIDRDIAAVEKRLDQATPKVKTYAAQKRDAAAATQRFGDALGLLPGPLGGIASQLTAVTRAVTGPAGLIAGFVGIVGAAALMAKSLGNDIEGLKNLSLQTGLSVASLQAFQQAAREAGEAPDTLVLGLGRVNQAINDILMGAPNAGTAFQAIGVNLRDLVKEGASTETILEATAKALAAIPDPTARAAAQMELFGTRGRAMSVVLDTIAKEGLGRYIEAMRQAGIVTSDATNKMATDIDALADRFDRAMTGMVTRAKAGAASIILAIAEAFRRGFAGLPSMPFPVPSSALGGFEPAPERPPPQDRILASSAEELAAMKAAETQRLMAAIEINEAIRKSREELQAALSAIDDRTRAEAAAGLQALKELAVAEEWAAMEKAVTAGSAALSDYVINLEEARHVAILNHDAIDANVHDYQELGSELGFSGQAARMFREHLEGLPPTITETGDAADREFLRTRDVIDEGVAALFRMRDALGPPILTPLEQFGQGFQAVADRGTAAFGTLEAQGRLTAQTLGTAFEDSFFGLMKGNLDDFDDIWKAALDAVLAQIAAFLAAEAVQGLLRLASSGINIGVSTSAGGGGGGFFDDAVNFLGNVLGFQHGGTVPGAAGAAQLAVVHGGETVLPMDALRLLQAILDQMSQLVVIERGAAEREPGIAGAGARVGGGGTGTGTGGGVGGGPAGGRTVAGLDFGTRADITKAFARDAIGFITGGFVGLGLSILGNLAGAHRRAQEAAEAAARAALDLTAAQTGAFRALDRATETTTALADVTTAAAQAAAQTAGALTNFQGDLSVLDSTVTDATQATSQTAQETRGFTGVVDILGSALADAAVVTGQAAQETQGFTGVMDILGPAMAEATAASVAAANTALGAARDAEDFAAHGPHGSAPGGFGHGGGPSPGAGGGHGVEPTQGGGGSQFGGGGPFGGLQHGGFVARPTRALIGERFPEVVLGPPSRQSFAREFAAAIAASLRGRLGGDGGETPESLSELRRIRRVLEQIARGGSPAGSPGV